MRGIAASVLNPTGVRTAWVAGVDDRLSVLHAVLRDGWFCPHYDDDYPHGRERRRVFAVIRRTH